MSGLTDLTWLSLDISRKATGVTLWKGEEPVDVTTIKLPATSLGEQLDLWDDEVQKLLLLARPALVAWEDCRAVSKQHGMIQFGQVGILLMHLQRQNIAQIGFAQTTVKKALTGKGNAKKPQMVAAAKERWPHLNVSDDNIADSLGVGLALIARMHSGSQDE